MNSLIVSGLSQSCAFAGVRVPCPSLASTATRDPQLDQAPFSSHPPFDAQKRQDDRKGPERAPESGLPLLDNLRRRMALQFGCDSLERFFVPVFDRDILSLTGCGDLLQ